MPTVTSLKPQRDGKRVNVYLDESGINRKIGASVYCLTVINSGHSGVVDDKILGIEEKLSIPPFHWREHNWKIKSKFLKEIVRIQEWKCFVVVINNENFSQTLLADLLARALHGLEIKQFYFDGKKSKAYSNSVKRSFKKLGTRVSSLKFVRNKSHGGLRLSDAIAGLVRLHYDGKTKSETEKFFKTFLKNKISAQIMNGY